MTLYSGDVGGQLGLFLGANIVTIFEFVDFYLRLFWYKFVTEYVFSYFKNRKRNDFPAGKGTL